LATNPVTEADRAYASGDRRYVVVPICVDGRGETLPGWPLTYTPAHDEAIKNGKRPVTCSDIGVDPGRQIFVRVAKYAEQYNQRMLELSAQGRR
jgi:hypothetical protein